MFNGELEVVQPRRRITVYGPQLRKKIYCLLKLDCLKGLDCL